MLHFGVFFPFCPYVYEITSVRPQPHPHPQPPQGGELFYKIKEHGRLEEDLARKYFQQLMNALVFCHRHQFAHRDIKPENIILTENGGLKVADFGISNLQKINESGKVSSSLHLKVSPSHFHSKTFNPTLFRQSAVLSAIWPPR